MSQRGIELIQGDQGLGIALVAAQKAEVLVTIVDTSQETINKGLNSVGPFNIPFFIIPGGGHFLHSTNANRPNPANKEKQLQKGISRGRLTESYAADTRERMG